MMKSITTLLVLLFAILLMGEDPYTYYEIPFEFEDISSTGTALPFPEYSQGDVSEAIDLPGTFKFYGTDYNQVIVSESGWISFNLEEGNNEDHVALPSEDAPSAMITPYWEDLGNRWYETGTGYIDANVYTESIDDKFVVMWDSLKTRYGGHVVSSLVLDCSNNTIKTSLRYLVIDAGNPESDYWTIGTIGIQNEDKTDGLTIFSRDNVGGEFIGEIPHAPISYQISVPTAAPPVAEPAGSVYLNSVEVTLSAEEGTVIYYTTDGTAPTTESSLYSSPLTFTTTTTLKAIAEKDGNTTQIVEEEYVIENSGTVLTGEVSGTLSLAGSPYFVTGNLSVANGTVLTIEAGIEMAFSENCDLSVNGTIIAQGTESDSIIFRPRSEQFSWQGIQFLDIDPSNQTSILDYVKICNAKTLISDSKGIENNGGGVFVKNTSTLTISNSLFINNEADFYGGGLFCNFSTITVDNCSFVNNKAVNGGGVYIRNSEVWFKNNTVSNNHADDGLGIYIFNGDTAPASEKKSIIENNTITGNVFSGVNGLRGGGIYCDQVNAETEIKGNIISYNNVVFDGAGIYVTASPSIILENNEIFGNISEYEDGNIGTGGGVCLTASVGKMINNKLYNNKAYNGAALQMSNLTDFFVFGNVISNNEAAHRAAVGFNGSNITFMNNTITDNKARTDGNGLFFGNGSSPDIINCLIYQNKWSEAGTVGTTYNIYIANDESQPNFYYCNLEDGIMGSGGGAEGTVYSGNYMHNLDLYPMFTAEENNEYNIRPLSPSINNGDPDSFSYPIPDTDIMGNPRSFNGSTLDIGAYEYQQEQNITEVGGDVSGTWSKDYSPYYVNSDITISENNDLEIEPGVEVIFRGHNSLIVNGTITAIGEKDEEITFTVSDTDGFADLSTVKGGWNHVMVNNDRQNAEFKYCEFSFGKAFEYYVNGIMGQTGGALVSLNSAPQIENCSFFNNISTFGGAVSAVSDNSYSGDRTMLIQHNRFSNCFAVNLRSANSQGGAIFVYQDKVQISGNLITNNTSEYHGGGICVYQGKALIVGNTIADNTGANGGAMLALGSEVDFYNNIIYANEAASANYGDQLYLYESMDCNFYNNDIMGGFAAIRMSEGDFTGVYDESNIDDDPLLIVSKENDEERPEVYLYSLAEESPCIDAGINEIDGFEFPLFDLVGSDRIMNETMDIGAFEFDNENGVDENIAINWDLSQNYPNPFNPETTIAYSVPSGFSGNVKLTIFNSQGQIVKELVNKNHSAGKYHAKFNGSNLSSGVYYYGIQGAEFKSMKKMLLVK